MFTRTLCAALSIVPMSAGVAAAAGPFSGPMHEKHGGEVVFANTPIPMDAATDDNLIAATSLDKPLFVRTWGADSADNLSPRCKRDARLVWWASVNGGERISVGLSNLSDEARKEPFAASFSGDAKVPVTTPTVVGADLDPGPDRIRDWNGALVPRLVEGTNAVHVWITIDCGYGQDDDPIVAKGDLTIEVKKGALDAYAKKYGPFLPKA
ncbi:MAG: hypothetical protein KC635_29130, partial [Myxococcales bacterium]|nr:hypothetical protein [Myxococcales bacterium]